MSSSSSSNSDVESNSTHRESMIEQFKNVTGTSNDSAKAILEACNWNLELAINMHVDGIESNEIPINRTNSNNLSSSVSSQTNNQDSDFVRAPIPPVRQILVDDGYEPSIMPRRPNASTVFDAFRDFQSEARWQERILASNGESSLDQSTISKKQTLEDLYRPPLDIMFRGTLEAAKEEGTKQNRWLLVNIQNVKEFACQILNRDVWSNSTVKEIIRDHFIFWQVCHEQSEGQRFIQFYNIHEYPHVSILDPRTGEKLNSFSASDVDSLCNFITEFINEHPTPNGNKQTPSSLPIGPSTASSSVAQNKIYDQSEEAQLKAAIAASLKEASNQKDDSDSSIEECEIFEDVQIEEVKENWKDFLAPEDGKEAQFKIRLPDGSFDQISFPANSQIKALILYISSKGFDTNKYDLTTPFPRRTLNNLNSSETLIQANLYPRTTIHIQEK